MNGIYIRKTDDDRLTREVLHRLAHRTDLSLGSIAAGRIRALMPQLKERAKTLVELANSAAFLARVVPLPMEPKAAGQLTAEARLLLRDIGAVLAATDFSGPDLDAALREFAERTGRKLGQVAQPLRAALTGSTVSPGIDATLAALGRDEALARIAAASA
jgi:glutamyl-tRNA synthetase